MLRIGITGGIGSGKSTVCSIFRRFGIPVYVADDAAKELMVNDPELRAEIVRIFGSEAYLSDGSLNRKYISGQAFPNPELLNRLNQAVHPAIARDFLHWSERQTAPYVLKEAALLFESGSYRDLDYVVTVYASKETRIKRSMERDGVTRAMVLERINKQWTEAQRQKAADFIIRNDGKTGLIKQVQLLHKQFIRLSGISSDKIK